MVEPQSNADGVAARVRAALESADLTAMGDLLDPNVCWGAPGDPTPGCQNRKQVLAWYQRGRAAGIRATVTELVPRGDKILVGLRVVGSPAAERQGGGTDRWQVLTIRGDRIVDIRAFDERAEAATRANVAV
jgi:ketosteroid isomerase-like protein